MNNAMVIYTLLWYSHEHCHGSLYFALVSSRTWSW